MQDQVGMSEKSSLALIEKQVSERTRAGRSLESFRIENATTEHGLLPAEEQLLACVAEGKWCELKPNGSAEDADLQKLCEPNRVRASFIGFLILGGDSHTPVHESGLKLEWALITEDLDLSNSDNVKPVSIVNSWIDGSINLEEARTRALDFRGSRVNQMRLNGARVQGNVALHRYGRRPFIADAGVEIIGAEIAGTLTCTGGHFKAKAGTQRRDALDCQRARITGSAYLRSGFVSEGKVNMNLAQIGGTLDCSGAKLRNSGGDAIDCSNSKIDGDVLICPDDQGRTFEADGRLWFRAASIRGDFNCKGAKLRNESGNALDCANAHIGGSVHLFGFGSERLEIFGSLYFESVQIDGQLIVKGAKIVGDHPQRVAIDCRYARIGGSFELKSHAFVDESRNRVTTPLFADGAVCLFVTQIGGNLWCQDALITNLQGDTLQCRTVSTGGDVILENSFQSVGHAVFNGCAIRGNFDCWGQFSGPKSSDSRTVLDIENVRVDGALRFYAKDSSGAPVQSRFDGALSLQRSKIGTLRDSPTSWAPIMLLDGLTYERIDGGIVGEDRFNIDTLMAWLMRQPKEHLEADFRPQPFEQLARVLRQMGHENAAIEIAIEKQKRLGPLRARAARRRFLRPLTWVAYLLFRWFSRYGYSPWPLIVSLLLLLLGSSLLFKVAADQNLFVPADPQIWASNDSRLEKCRGQWTQCTELAEIPRFNPFIYALDTILPIVDLKQKSSWTPIWKEFDVELPGLGRTTAPAWVAKSTVWLASILGPLATILLGVILSGIIKRE